MSCICQYMVHSKENISNSNNSQNKPIMEERELQKNSTSDKDLPHTSRSNISATDLAAAQAEVWILRKSLEEARISIENLESLVRTIIDKQHQMLTEVYHLKKLNYELQDECRMQREYHCMERNAMIRELNDIKIVLTQRNKDLHTVMTKNRELYNSLEDANKKLYLISVKYFKLKELSAAVGIKRNAVKPMSESSTAGADENNPSDSANDTDSE